MLQIPWDSYFGPIRLHKRLKEVQAKQTEVVFAALFFALNYWHSPTRQFHCFAQKMVVEAGIVSFMTKNAIWVHLPINPEPLGLC